MENWLDVEKLDEAAQNEFERQKRMKTFKIVHREELIGWFYVDAETPEEALEEYYRQVCNGEIDFGDLEMVDSEDKAEEDE